MQSGEVRGQWEKGRTRPGRAEENCANDQKFKCEWFIRKEQSSEKQPSKKPLHTYEGSQADPRRHLHAQQMQQQQEWQTVIVATFLLQINLWANQRASCLKSSLITTPFFTYISFNYDFLSSSGNEDDKKY